MSCDLSRLDDLDLFMNPEVNVSAILDCYLDNVMNTNQNTTSSSSSSSSSSSFNNYDFLNAELGLSPNHVQQRNNWAKNFSAYLTPFIIVVGLVGNVISLRVFSSTRLRKLSASFYLAALSASDTVVLLTYVLGGWLLRGLSAWQPEGGEGGGVDLVNKKGFCHGFLFISYVFRFISVYLIVIFTVERYIAVCRPLQRRSICTKSFARRVILAIHVVAVFVSVYKPLLSGLYPSNPVSGAGTEIMATNFSGLSEYWYHGMDDTGMNTETTVRNSTNYLPLHLPSIETEGVPKLNINSSHHDMDLKASNIWASLSASSSGYVERKICTWNPNYESFHFVLELCYGLLITAVPFLLVAVFNVLMLKELITKHFFNAPIRAVFRKSKMKIEFTVTVIAVSTCFILLNIPYFVAWLLQNLQTFSPSTTHDVVRRNSAALSVTRTIFSINYSINFFVYCLTGSFYRSVIKNMFGCSQPKNHAELQKKGLESTACHNSTTEAMLSHVTEL